MRTVVTFNYSGFQLNNVLVTITTGFVPLNFFNCANHWDMNGMFVFQFSGIAFIELKGTQISLKALLDGGVHGGSQLFGIIPVTGR